MKRAVIIFFLQLFFLSESNHLFSQPTNDQQLAAHYFQEAEYDKAAMYYEKLYNKKPSSFYYGYLLKCLIEIKEYKEAEKLIKKHMKTEPGNAKFYIDLGDLYKVTGDETKSKKEFENAIKELTGDYQQAITIGYAFREKSEFDYALRAYEQAEKSAKGFYDLSQQKGEVLGLKGDIRGMLEQYLAKLDKQPKEIATVQSLLATSVNFEEPNNARMEMLRTEILKRVQKNPDNDVYNEMLIWFYQSKGDYNSAFVQVKAFDKRNKDDGRTMYNFGRSCRDNDHFDIAIKAFEYLILEKGKDNPYYLDSKIELVDVLSKKVVNRGIYEQADLISLEKNYVETLAELKKSTSTINLMRGLAKLRAFYLHNAEGAEEILLEVVNMPGISPVVQAEAKLELADVLLIQGETWEASLYYYQVDLAFKQDVLGQEAKFKNAKISFYTGDFKWAQAQLDVLKTSTSKYIANDAMQLSLLITDNLGIDSVVEALKLYAEADLLVFQNRYDDALLKLDTLNGRHPWHSLKDEAQYVRYKINMKRQLYDKAAEDLQVILDNYATDILADDALFNMAELQHYYFKNTDKASELYKQLMFDFPGSSYVVDARKRFRQLRGEDLN